MIEKPPGVTTNWGPEQIADRINNHLTGDYANVAREYLNPSEMARLRGYADRLRASARPPTPRTDVVAREVERINGIGGQGATAAEMERKLYGTGSGDNAMGVKLAQHVRDTYGVNSEPYQAIRRGMYTKLTDGTPAQVVKKIDDYLNGKGRPMSALLHNKVERDALDSLRDLNQRLMKPQASGQWSNNAAPIIEAGTRGVTHSISHFIGQMVSPGVGGFVGAHIAAPLAGKFTMARSNAAKLRQMQKQMPLLADTMGRWQKAANRALPVNAPPRAQAQVTFAANQVNRVLTHMDPSLALKNFRAAAGNNQQQQNQANPPPQRHTGGRVEKQDEVFDPRSIGARQARDGHWRVPDQSRLRKYLTPTPGMRRRRWPGLLAAAGRLDQRLRRARTTGHSITASESAKKCQRPRRRPGALASKAAAFGFPEPGLAANACYSYTISVRTNDKRIG